MTDQQQAAANNELREACKALNDEDIDRVSGGLSMYDFWPQKFIIILSHLVSSSHGR